MKSPLFYFLAVFILAVAADSNNAIDEKNGFKKYKLGTVINSYSGFTYADAKHQSTRPDSCSVVYQKDPEMADNIGEVKVSKIYLTTSADTITKIEVPLGEPAISKVLDAFTKEFGKYETVEKDGNPIYKWAGKNVTLSLVDNAHRRGNKDYAKGPSDVISVTSKDMDLVRKRCSQHANNSADSL